MAPRAQRLTLIPPSAACTGLLTCCSISGAPSAYPAGRRLCVSSRPALRLSRRRCPRCQPSAALQLHGCTRAGAGACDHRAVALHARFRRPLAHRGVRPGRADQFLSGRCQRPHRHAADRLGDGERRDHRPAVGRASPRSCATAISASRMWRSRSKPTGRSSSSARSPRRANIPTSPT